MPLRTNSVGPVPVGVDLEVTVGNLLRSLPKGANAFLIIVCDSRFVEVKRGTVKDIVVDFVPVGKEGLAEGHFILAYSYEDVPAKQGGVGREHGDPVDNVLNVSGF